MNQDFGFTVKRSEKALRRRTADVLKMRDDTGAHMNRLVDVVNRRADELITERRTLPGNRVACGQGCSWCCYAQIHPTAPEVLRLADYIRETFTPEELAALRTRLAELDGRTRGLTMRELMPLRLPCALLVEGRCSVYRVRPLICRGWNSTSAAACERRSSTPDAGQVGIMQAMRDGALCEGIKDARRDDAFMRLPVALLIALDDAEARRKWLAGDPVFATARSSE